MFRYSQFMREFAAVWKWTVEQRMGVFSPSLAKSTKMRERPPPIPVKQHSLLIEVSLICASLATICFVIISQFLPLQFLTDRFDVVSTRNTAQVCTVWFQSVSKVDFTSTSHYIGVPDSRIVSPVPHPGSGSQQPSDAVFLPWTWSNKCKIQVWELLCY